MKTREKTTILVLIGLLGVTILGIQPISLVRGEETGDGSLFVDDVGTYFEITNSMYLNITLTSTETVRVLLESVPRIVSFLIESNDSETTTDLAFTGFEPSTTYYKYQDGYLIEGFTTDSSGGYTYTQDVSEPHHVFIQEDQLTIDITSNYTFTQNITETIVVAADNIVIDGNGYALEGPGFGIGFYLSGRSGVTIKNVVIKGWTFAISLQGCIDNTISMNHMVDNWYAIVLRLHCNGNTISMNTIRDSYHGIYLYGYCTDNAISGNTILNNRYGIELWTYCTGCTIYHNNIIDNTVQARDYNPAYNDWHHPDLLEGNYWSDYLGVDDGSGTGKHAIAGDGIGDTHIPHYHDFYPLMQPWILEPAKACQNLIETIESWDLRKGTKNCLTSKLEDAIGLLNRGNINGAIHKIGDFIDQVTNDRKDLTEDQRSYLLLGGNEILWAISNS